MRMIAASTASDAVWPMNRSVPAVVQVWPGVWPWIGIAGGAAGAVEQPKSSAGARSETLRIDRLLLMNPAHLELAVLDCEGEASFDQVERVLAELLVAPTAEDVQVAPHAGSKRLEIVGPRDEAGGDARF